MKNHPKLKLRSERGSLHGEQLSSFMPDSSFSNDDRESIDFGTNSVQLGNQTYTQENIIPYSYHQPQQIIYNPQQQYQYTLIYVPNPIPGGPPLPTPAVPLGQFKTKECRIKNKHDHKQCPHYHSMKDRRRPINKVLRYEPEQCPYASTDTACKRYETCQYSHNMVEQFYHPKKYKTKLCAKAVSCGLEKCDYGQFCSFAHAENELKIQCLHRMAKTPEFFKYYYKTVYCPFTYAHDKSICEFAHNVQDYRRNPKTTPHYKPEVCKKWNMHTEISKYEDGGCNYNEACDKCHGWKELEYHPKYYKTKACTNGERCPRKHCGYLHPDDAPVMKTEVAYDSYQYESMRESRTSSSVKPRAIVRASESLYSSSRDEMVMTSNSNSLSKFNYNMDSVRGRIGEDDNTDLDSLINNDHGSRYHPHTEFAMEEKDLHFPEGIDHILPIDSTMSIRYGRKFSVETFMGGSEKGFRLSSQSSSINELSKSFLSPLKLMEEYGPGSEREPISRPSSPDLSVRALRSVPENDPEVVDDIDIFHSVLRKYGLTEDSLLSKDSGELRDSMEIEERDQSLLCKWREKILLENQKRREEGIIYLIDDLQDKCFRKY